MLAEGAEYGTVTTRRIYGDWTTPEMAGWKDSPHSHAVQPQQRFRYTRSRPKTTDDLLEMQHDKTQAGPTLIYVRRHPSRDALAQRTAREARRRVGGRPGGVWAPTAADAHSRSGALSLVECKVARGVARPCAEIVRQ